MAHTYSNLVVYVIFSTKARAPTLSDDVRVELFSYMGAIIQKLRGEPILINGVRDHVLFVMPHALSLADCMEKVKANSSKWLKQRWPQKRQFAWQAGYAGFSVSQSKLLKSVEAYIANQGEHHRKTNFQKELLAFLKKHSIEYDPRYVFD